MRVLPDQARCTPWTRPRRQPKPDAPATSQVAASCPGRPSQDSRSRGPGRRGVRTRRRSKPWWPVISSSSTASEGTGSSRVTSSTSNGEAPSSATSATRAHPHQAGGLQTDLGDDVDAVNGVDPPARRRHRRRLPVPHPSSPRGRRSRRGRRRRNRPAGEEGARDRPTSPDAAGAAPAGRRQSRCGWFPCSSSGRYAGPSGRRPRGRRDPHPSGARRGSGPAAGPEPLRCRRGASGEEEPRWWRWGGGRSSSSQRSSVNVDSVRRRVRRTRRRWDR